MTIALDTLMSNSRIQNAGNIPKTPNIERNHYAGISGHEYYGFNHKSNNASSGKKSIALTALTLLAFMFFLNILQNCLQEQMTTNQSPQVMVLASRVKQQKEADERKDEQIQDDIHLIGDDASRDGEQDKTYLQIAKRILPSNDKGTNDY